MRAFLFGVKDCFVWVLCLRFRSLCDLFPRSLAIAIAICAFTAAPSSHAVRRGTPTVVDADLSGGLGDLLALTLAVRNPHLEIVGVITAESPGSERVRVISHWLKFLDRPDIKVGEGGPARDADSLPSFWVRDPPLASPPLSASRVIATAVEASGTAPQVLLLGSGSAFSDTLIQDPSLASSFRKIVWTRPSDAADPFSGVHRDREIGKILFDASCALVACSSIGGYGVDLSPEDWIALGTSRLELTDEITLLAARGRQQATSERPSPQVPYVLSVGVASGPPGATVETKWIRKDVNDSIVFDTTGERKLSLVSPPPNESLHGYILRELTDPGRDFKVDFAHFLNALLRLDSETKEALKGKLNAPFESNSQGNKTSREQMLEFLEIKLRALKESDSASVASALNYLESAYLGFAGIGWWFPNDFYMNWRLDPPEQGTVRFGIANPAGVPLERLAASVRIGDVSLSQSVDSASNTVEFDFDLPPDLGNLDRPASAELSWRFDCGAGLITRSRTVDLSVR